MSVVKAADIPGLFNETSRHLLGVLVHGADRSAVFDLCKRIVRSATGVEDETQACLRLAEQQVTSSRERLATELASVSLFGGKQVVWVSDVGDAMAKVVEPLLEMPAPENLLLLDAEALPKTSKLRKLFEASPHFASVALYEESPQELRGRLLRQIQSSGMQVSDEAMERLMELISFERAVGESEVSKLITYCHGQKTVELEDVLAICGDTSEASGDDLVDAVFGGNLADADRFLASLDGSRGGLNLALQHVTKLQAMALQVSQGSSIDTVVNSPRFGIFFKRRGAVSSQLRAWDLKMLLGAEEKICSAILLTRQHSALDEIIVNRTLLALSRSARLNQAR